MGKLIYGPQQREIELDDRPLAHLEMAMLNKLRRQEPFAFSWQTDPSEGSGRHTIWIAPTATLEFVFYGGRSPRLNRAWVEQLIMAADRGNMQLGTEPEEVLSPPPREGTRQDARPVPAPDEAAAPVGAL